MLVGEGFSNEKRLVVGSLPCSHSAISRRVQYLRGLIQSGQYRVDSAALSESILTASQFGD